MILVTPQVTFTPVDITELQCELQLQNVHDATDSLSITVHALVVAHAQQEFVKVSIAGGVCPI